MQLADDAPRLLVLEDMHWADRSTRDLVAFLARNLRGERIAVVLTYRTGELRPAHPMRRLLTELVRRPRFVLVEVAPLSRADVGRQLEAIAGRPVQDAASARVYERSGGNPFFVEELCAADLEHVPATLTDTVMLRVARLSEPAQRLLAVVAAAGGAAEHDVVAAVTDADATGAGVREAVDAGLFVADATSVALRHGLIGEIVYGTLVPAERRELHHALATVLAAEGAPAAQLAYQWQHAGVHDDALAASVDAGLDAERVYAFAEARTHFERALELWDAASAHPIDHVERSRAPLRRRATRATASGRSRSVTRRSPSSTSRPSPCAPPASTSGWASTRRGTTAPRSTTTSGRSRSCAGPSPDRARLLAAQGHALMGLRRWPEARDRCEAALAIADDVQAAAAGLTLGLVLAYLGDAAAGEARLRDALRSATALGAADSPPGRTCISASSCASAAPTPTRSRRCSRASGSRLGMGCAARSAASCSSTPPATWSGSGAGTRRRRGLRRRNASSWADHGRACTGDRRDAVRAARRAGRARAHWSAPPRWPPGHPGRVRHPIRRARRRSRSSSATRAGAPAGRGGADALAEDCDPLYAPALHALGFRAEAERHAGAVRAERLLAELDGSWPEWPRCSERALARAERSRVRRRSGRRSLGSGRRALGVAGRAAPGRVRAVAPAEALLAAGDRADAEELFSPPTPRPPRWVRDRCRRRLSRLPVAPGSRWSRLRCRTSARMRC